MSYGNLIARLGNAFKPTVVPELPVHKKYVCSMSQGGTANPFVGVLENTIGNIVWTRFGVGDYRGTLVGAFPETNTIVFNNITNGNVHIVAVRASNDLISIQARSIDGFPEGVNVDSAINQMSLEIRVYP